MDPLIEVQRQEYERVLNFLWQKKTQNCVLMNKHEYAQKLQRLLELEDPMVRKTTSDYRLLKTTDYLIQEVDGARVRKLCKRGTDLLYVPIEDMFNIIYNAHIQLKHAGRNNLQNFFRDKYANITKDCIMTFLKMCKSCPRKKRIHETKQELIIKKEMIRVGTMSAGMSSGNGVSNSGILSNEDVDIDGDDDDNEHMLGSPDHDHALSPSAAHASSMLGIPMGFAMNFIKPHKRERTHHAGETESFTRGQIDVLDMQKQRDGEWAFIFKYTNLTSNEIRLRPMKYGTPQEAADLLISIYCDQGAPAVMQSLNGRQFVEEVVREIYRMWPDCKQLHGEFRTSNLASSTTASSTDSIDNTLLEHLMRLQKRNNTNSWACLLRHLQWAYNTNYLPELGRTPIEGTQSKVPSLGLPQSKLLEAIYDKARSEEQIMEYLNDAELLRLSAFCAGPMMEKRARSSNFLEESMSLGSVVHSLSQLSNTPLGGTCTTSSTGELLLNNDMAQSSTSSASSYSNQITSCVPNVSNSVGIGATATPLDTSNYLDFSDLQMNVQTAQNGQQAVQQVGQVQQVQQQQTTPPVQHQNPNAQQQAMHVVTQDQMQQQVPHPSQQQHTPQSMSQQAQQQMPVQQQVQQQMPPQQQQMPPQVHPQQLQPQPTSQQVPTPQQVAPPPQYMSQHHHYAMMQHGGAQHSPQMIPQQQQMQQQLPQQDMMGQVNVSVSQVSQVPPQVQQQHTPQQMGHGQQHTPQDDLNQAHIKAEMENAQNMGANMGQNGQNPGQNPMMSGYETDMNMGLVSRALNC